MRFTQLLTLAASAAAYTWVPKYKWVKPEATFHIPQGSCS